MSYKVEAVKQLAQEIKATGFRVFLAQSGTYGFYTNAEGSKVVCFQFDLGGFKYSGKYKTEKPSQTGAGWGLAENSFENMFKQMPPQWATSGFGYKFTTLDQHLATYQASSKYTEV